MTDNTQPEAMDLADWLEAVGGGGLSPNRCAALLREQHTRIAELEAQLAAIGAGGVSGPLMGKPQAMPDLSQLTAREALRTIGDEQAFEAWFKMDCPVEGANAKIAAKSAWKARASLSANAGEPVAWMYHDARSAEESHPWLHSTMVVLAADRRPGLRGETPLYAAPPTAQAEGWRPIETAPKYTEHGVRRHLMLGYAPDEIYEDGFVSQGYWMEAEEDAPDNMGHDGGWVDVQFDFFRCGRSFGAEAYRTAGTQPTHWMPLPLPPTSAEGVEHG